MPVQETGFYDRIGSAMRLFINLTNQKGQDHEEEQDIMAQAGADDRNGELQAYMVEREFMRVMREFFGRELIDYEGKAMKAMKDAVGGMLAAPANAPSESH